MDDDDELALLLPVNCQSEKKRHNKVAPCLKFMYQLSSRVTVCVVTMKAFYL